jgi:hypothetical protein
MGTGIIGAIPISFRFGSMNSYSPRDEQKNKAMFIRHAPNDFFDFYNEEPVEVDGKEAPYYVIKPEILLPNFKPFFYEFHRLIGGGGVYSEAYEKFNEKYDSIVEANDLDAFIEYFTDHSGYGPTIFSYFEPTFTVDSTNLLIYQGSYKVIMEEESSLAHMERLLWAAMSIPPAHTVRIGMSL